MIIKPGQQSAPLFFLQRVIARKSGEMEPLLESEVPHKLIFLDIDGVLNRHPQLHISLIMATRLRELVGRDWR